MSTSSESQEDVAKAIQERQRELTVLKINHHNNTRHMSAAARDIWHLQQKLKGMVDGSSSNSE